MSSAFEHPWLAGLFADDAMADLWSAAAQLEHYRAFEAAWSRAGHLAGLWSANEGEAAARAIEALDLRPEALREGTGKDGVPIPAFVRLLKAETGLEAIHQGATSQDVMDTSLALSMTASLALIETRLGTVAQAGAALVEHFGAHPLMGRTRMQAAQQITVADRVQAWTAPLADHLRFASQLRPDVGRVQIGGAAGDRAALGDKAEVVTRHVAEALSLTQAPQWHAQRGGVAQFAGLMSLITGTLGKMGQDLALMAQMGEVRIAGAGGSSAMPHKQNPVKAELLVTLARFNATQIAGIHQAMVHEQERSGAAWTLEWMLLPQMAQATGRALTLAEALFEGIEEIGSGPSEQMQMLRSTP